jgi:hypothetical protein
LTPAAAPTYVRTRVLFLRALGLVYLAAFLSLRWQVAGLLGSDGLLPARSYLERASMMLGPSAGWQLPTLFWLDASDAALHGACVAGSVAALLLVAGVAPLAMLVVLWVLYLSLVGVGQLFLSYQWDALLLETGFLAIFWAPRGWRLGAAPGRPSAIVLWMLRWLLFRLMFFSGFVKLASGDPTWWHLDALKVHYQTQPLPTWTSWYAHQLPGWLQQLSCAVMFVIELLLPFAIVLGRRARLVAFLGLVSLQIGIAATGNYGFFNLLAIVLCLPLLDDAHLAYVWPRRDDDPGRALRQQRRWKTAVDATVAALLLALSVPLAMTQLIELPPRAIRPVAALLNALGPFHLTSTYGLFAVMTTTRPEMILEGSRDGATWTPYVFRWKPGPLSRAPTFVGFGMPRLDWQMWFDALYVERMLASGSSGANLITPRLLEKLRAGTPSVLGLLAGDPFDGEPPRELRWRLDDYRFTDAAQRAATGNWWQRTLIHQQEAR